MTTNSPPTSQAPMAPYQPSYDENASASDLTLWDLHDILLDMQVRQARIETRLVRLMREHQLDHNGDPIAE